MDIYQETQNVIIDPDPKDAKIFAKWLLGQGDARGLVVSEKGETYIIVFDSYGNTHHDIVKWLNITRNVYSVIFTEKGIDDHLYGFIPWKRVTKRFSYPKRIDEFLLALREIILNHTERKPDNFYDPCPDEEKNQDLWEDFRALEIDF